MILYMICDEDGHVLTDGLTEGDAYDAAKSMAEKRGQSVEICPSSEKGNTEYEGRWVSA